NGHGCATPPALFIFIQTFPSAEPPQQRWLALIRIVCLRLASLCRPSGALHHQFCLPRAYARTYLLDAPTPPQHANSGRAGDPVTGAVRRGSLHLNRLKFLAQLTSQKRWLALIRTLRQAQGRLHFETRSMKSPPRPQRAAMAFS